MSGLFITGKEYSRTDVYELLNIPTERRRGQWETGYASYEGAYYIFANVGTAGRTGHSHENRWLEDGSLLWHGKANSHKEQPGFNKLLTGGKTHIFTRPDNRERFTYQGIGIMVKAEGSKPVEVVWRFDDAIAHETDEDERRLQKEINTSAVPIPQGAQHTGETKPAPDPMEINGRKYYRHSIDVAENALSYADFKCEINPDHATFIRRKTGQPYTEAHHLIPMSKQPAFNVSLDVEENVVSLCSNCHNRIHYGKDADELIKYLFEKRQKELEKVGIEITIQDLLGMY